MAVPTDTLWERDPHTAAKHRVLGGYFKAWFPILLQAKFVDSVTVFEGFAGPGEYEDGPEGSPLLAMRSLLQRPELVQLGKPVRFVFLEEREDRVRHLRTLIDDRLGDLPAHVTCVVRRGRCETDAGGLLDEVGAWGAPIFANLDPFDANVPLALVRRLASNPASEVLVTFMLDRLRRFASTNNLALADAMFGSTHWREVQHIASPAGKEAFLLDAYRTTLHTVGLDKVAGFKLVDEGGRSFWLLYGTRHPTGLDRMKRAMWDVDPVTGVRFRDPRDPAQGQLDLSYGWQPNLAPLRRMVLGFLEKVGRVELADVVDFVDMETAYLRPHTRKAVRQLVDDGAVGCHPAKGRLANATEVWPVQAEEPSLFDV